MSRRTAAAGVVHVAEPPGPQPEPRFNWDHVRCGICGEIIAIEVVRPRADRGEGQTASVGSE